MKIVSFNKPVLFVKYLVYIALTFGITGTVGHKWDTLSIKLLQVLHCQKKKNHVRGLGGRGKNAWHMRVTRVYVSDFTINSGINYRR